jgi:hypothetical protein
MLAGFERRHGKLVMRVTWRADIDDIDIVAVDHVQIIRRRIGNAELRRRLCQKGWIDIAKRYDLAAGISRPAWQVRSERPATSPEHANTYLASRNRCEHGGLSPYVTKENSE